MSYTLEFSKTALEDIEKHKKVGDKSTLKKLQKLLNELMEHHDACTNTTDPNNIVIIIEDVNITPVEMAQFILHEAIHAEIARYVAQYQSGVDVNDRPYLFELYKHYKELYDSGDIDHIYMTLNYINPINAALRVFDDNNFPSNYYSSFTWDGLRFWDAGDLLSIEEDEANALRRIEVIENSSACE